MSLEIGNGQWEMAGVVSVGGSMAEQCTRWQWKGTEKAGGMAEVGDAAEYGGSVPSHTVQHKRPAHLQSH
jgi:hypothetical protein